MIKNLKSFHKTIVVVFTCLLVGQLYARPDLPKIAEVVRIKMPDSIQLAGDLYLPEKGKQFTTILVRTPYGKQQHVSMATVWSRHGYAVLIQDTRGKWQSKGEFFPFINELNDGLATLDWIQKQRWSDGKVCIWGTSYLSYCGLVLASHGHSALKALFVESGWLKGDKTLTSGGAMHLMLGLAWILHEETQKVRSIRNYDLEDLCKYRPLIDVFKSIGINSKIWTDRFKDLQSFEKGLSLSNIKIPVFHVTGWHDFVCPASLNVYQEVSKQSKAPNKLIVGPWFHDQMQTTYTEVGDEDFGPVSAMGRAKLNRLMLRWFDFVTKNKNNGIQNEPNVRVFVMGNNQWENFDQWPPKNVSLLKWYINAKKGANSSKGDGTLRVQMGKRNGFDTYIFDPLNPVPTYGGANFHFFPHLLGIKDQREIEERRDVLVYTSEPLEKDIKIVGLVRVSLFASSEGKDTDFTAKFVEVRKNGYARIINEGIIRAGFRDSISERHLLIPGKIYSLNIDLGPTAITIKKGNRLRLEISSSNFPKYDRNPNTGEDSMTATIFKKVRQKIHFGRSFPSCIILPLLKI